MNLKHLILTPDAAPEVRESDLGYDDIVGVVGYPVEVINIHAGGTTAVMYVCEEGKEKGMPLNEAATRMAQGSLRDDDTVVGTALVVGPPSVGGMDTSLSDEALAALMADGDIE